MAATTNANPRNLSIGGGSAALPPTAARVADDGSTHGMLRVIGNDQLVGQEMEELALQKKVEDEAQAKFHQDQGIAAHVRERFYEFRNIRETRGVSLRLLESLRQYRGEYDPQKLGEIRQFGGSTVFSRVTATKCRGATAMLRDIYLSNERPWYIEPTPVPSLPEDVTRSMLDLINVEVQNAQRLGQPIDDQQIRDRVAQLTKAARIAAGKQAEEAAEVASRYLDDFLVEGGFYDALTEFLHYIAVFPYALLKGPTVRMATDVKWDNGEAVVKDEPKMFWESPNPFDIYWQTGARDWENTDIIEHLRLTRSEIGNLLGVPGYDDKAIREVLERFGDGGLSSWMDYTSTERAQMEGREDPHINWSDMIDALEFHGKIQGRMLQQYGFSKDEVPDADVDYFCTAWVIDSSVLKVQIDANPRKRHPYYRTSFEKIPGATVGYGLPEVINDIQEVANATLRAMVNNLSIASGPQVVVNDERVAPNSDTDNLYPWKRWHVQSDPMGSAEPAVNFYQPSSNSQELLGVYQQMTVIADEISGIPRYMTGSSNLGGAGRTASGLQMLMQNAGKVLQSVAANIDADIFAPLLQKLYDTVLLTDESNFLKGDEQIQVRGVTFANQREVERTRMLEFLQMTANPIDSQIVGMEGRAELLREIASRIGLDHQSIVPDQQKLEMQQQAQQVAAAQQGMAGGAPPDEAGNVDEGLSASQRGPSGNI